MVLGGADVILLGLRDIGMVFAVEYSLHIAVTMSVISLAFWILTEDIVKERRVLVLKGLTFGIPELKYQDALKVATNIINEKRITTVVWDGQHKRAYPNSKGAPPAASFTRLLEMIFVKDTKERIEFMYFARDEVSGEELLEGSDVAPDEHGNVVGPFPFLTENNTDIVLAGKASRPPRRQRGRHVGIVLGDGASSPSLPSSHSSSSSSSLSSSFASEELPGLSLYRYLKEKLRVTEVNTLVLGMGEEISKEHARMAKEPKLYPKLSVTEITVARSNKHHTIEEHEVAMF